MSGLCTDIENSLLHLKNCQLPPEINIIQMNNYNASFVGGGY